MLHITYLDLKSFFKGPSIPSPLKLERNFAHPFSKLKGFLIGVVQAYVATEINSFERRSSSCKIF